MQSMGVIGLGAFGQMLVERLQPWFDIKASDPAPEAKPLAASLGVPLVSPQECANCRYVVLAVPVLQIGSVIASIAKTIQPGTIVLDVASVKLGPARQMDAGLPPSLPLIGTHPLFGPQSAKTGLSGLKIAICPIRGASTGRTRRLIRFLREQLDLDAFESDPETHDRDMAMVQGLTHLVAKVLQQMEPLPDRQTTLSFDHLVRSMELVRGDSDELFRAIEQENPYSAETRDQFFKLIDELRSELEKPS